MNAKIDLYRSLALFQTMKYNFYQKQPVLLSRFRVPSSKPRRAEKAKIMGSIRFVTKLSRFSVCWFHLQFLYKLFASIIFFCRNDKSGRIALFGTSTSQGCRTNEEEGVGEPTRRNPLPLLEEGRGRGRLVWAGEGWGGRGGLGPSRRPGPSLP